MHERQSHDLVGLIFPFLPPYIIIYVLYFIFSQLLLIITGANMEQTCEKYKNICENLNKNFCFSQIDVWILCVTS